MAKRNITEGICLYCSKSYSGSAMTRHLESCEKRKNYYVKINKQIKNKSQSHNNIVFLLRIYFKYYPKYWMYLEVDGTAKLKVVDKFLRDTWLECCGHLSMFTIKGERYESHLDTIQHPLLTKNSKTLSISTESVFQPGITMDYVYDFGSSTELLLNVVSDRPGKITGKGKIKLVARNNDIFKCAKCKKETATKICTVCIYEKDRTRASLCNNCADLHECGEEMVLPIINSPRSGECGYEG